MAAREYDIVVHGATGFTGLKIAEEITKHFPTNLKWAIAGRSATKLAAVAGELKALNVDRPHPKIEEVSLSKPELAALAKRTKVLLNAVGPYHKYSTPVVEACAENGTHYVDVTGETPWVAQMVEKYHETAKRTGAIIIPQCGNESAPPDVLSYATAQELRERAGRDTAELVYAVYRFRGAPSGGTIATVLGIFDTFGALGLHASVQPHAMTPAPLKQPVPAPKSIVQRLFGVRTVRDIGLTTTNPVGDADVPIVYRTWALLQSAGARADAYGPNFIWTPALITRNLLTGVLTHVLSSVFSLFIALSPVRALLKLIARAPGTGPTREEEAKGMLDTRALAVPKEGAPRAHGHWRWEGGLYHMTAVLIATAGEVLLYDGDSNVPAKQLGGGVLTPATLGKAYIERLQKQGVSINVKMIQ